MSNLNKNTLDKVISFADNFQYAINIKYDLYSDEKIKNYIPTMSAIEIIEDVMLSTAPSSTDRARIFVGPYGKGKSHLALVILSILCRNDKSLYENLLSYICQYNSDLCERIKEYQNSKRKMLPVVIQGGGMGFRQSMLFSLKKALEDAELEDVMPNTYFKAAVSTIESWKDNYPETYNSFISMIDCSPSEFISSLLSYDNEYYEKFVDIYPSLTSGSDFNPVSGLDVGELYTDVSKKIKDFGYSGIYVIYDEFSKYLEGNIKKIQGEEIEALQRFAELCNRSKNNQIHIMLISHKSILNYMDGNLSKTKVDNWKAVSNRFKTVSLNTSTQQTYGLISHVIKHDEKLVEYLNKNEELKKQIKKFKASKMFSDVIEDDVDTVVLGCYPLSPFSTFLLPRISESIAQNERTLFTFLSSDSQPNTLPNVIKSMPFDQLNYVTPDIIFDYFEPLFKMEGYDNPIHKYWKNAAVAIEKINAEDFLQIKIIKTVALIYILNRFDLLSPDVDTLYEIYCNEDSVGIEINELGKKGILRKLENTSYLRIAENIDININNLINDEFEKIRSKYSLEEVLNNFIGNKVLYPNAYNDDHEIVRFFDFKFVSSKKIKSINKEIGNSNDGVVFAVIPDSKDMIEISNSVSSINNVRTVFIILKNNDEPTDNIYKWFALKCYLEKSFDDVLNSELLYSLNDLEQYVESFVDGYLKPELNKSFVYYKGEKQYIKRRSALSLLLSNICEKTYYKAPIIKNELINKNNISSQAINSRSKLVTGLLDSNLKDNLGLSGSGQEINFMRSLLIVPGILKQTEQGVILNLKKIPDDNLQNVINEIVSFVKQTSKSGPKSFDVLYEKLMSPKNHIGLKRGVIPVYLSCVLNQYKKYAVITKNGKEIEISSRLLDSINVNPDEYSLYIENWNADKTEYLEKLDELFSGYLKPSDKAFNDFDYIVKGIQRWYLQLPKYAKDTRMIYNERNQCVSLDAATIKFANAIKSVDLNSRELLFSKFLNIYGSQEFDSSLIKMIADSKNALDTAKSNLINHLSSYLINLFGKSDFDSLYSAMKNWYDDLSLDAKNHMFGGSENLLLDIIGNMTPDEEDFIERFSRAASGIRIDDWADITVDVFKKSVQSFVEIVESFNNNSNSSSETGTYTISFVDEKGIETIKTFDKTEYSNMAKLMYNDAESMIEEYGESITKNEKRQILFDIINNLLG